jgi:hypothetical protein
VVAITNGLSADSLRRMTVKRLLSIATVCAAAATTPGQAFAEVKDKPVENVQVSAVMCSESKACTAYLTGQVGNGKVCESTNAVRWDASSPAGGNMLSLVLAAHLSGKSITAWYHDRCNSKYHELAYMKVQ